MADLEKRMREAAANLEFEQAARLRDELKRLEATELMIGSDPMARQQAIEEQAGAYKGSQKYGRAANLPSGRSSNRPHKPADADMGPHNFGGGEGKPRVGPAPRGRKPTLDEMGPGSEQLPAGADALHARPERPDPKTANWRKRGRGR